MTRVAIHMLTAYPPSNPNRDETGQPKTAVVGGKTRQRISSQCIKRNWRLSEPMTQLDEKFSMRTRGLGSEVLKRLTASGTPPKIAMERSKKIAEKFGKVDGKRAPDHSEMVVFGHEEWNASIALAELIGSEQRDPTEAELNALPRATQSIDCALFGRMRAADPSLNVDAAVSVSHCLTTNQANIDSDFWTSVDDLKQADERADGGAGGMGDVEFGSGIYYTYVDIDVAQLIKNLSGDTGRASNAIAALIKAMATTTPGGHRTTFGHQGRASYLRAEIGDSSGNLFCPAFESPINSMGKAIEALRTTAEKIGRVYSLEREVSELSVTDEIGTLSEVVQAAVRTIER